MDVVALTTERRILDYNPEFSTSSVRTPLRGRRRKQPAGFLQVATFHGADDGVPAPCFAERSAPPSQARSGGFLKTAHRAVFFTETHLIGSSPTGPSPWVFPVAIRSNLVGAVGLEPTSPKTEDFKSPAYANSATLPFGLFGTTVLIIAKDQAANGRSCSLRAKRAQSRPALPQKAKAQSPLPSWKKALLHCRRILLSMPKGRV